MYSRHVRWSLCLLIDIICTMSNKSKLDIADLLFRARAGAAMLRERSGVSSRLNKTHSIIFNIRSKTIQ